ncbi:MAG: DUF3617 domain-containing protein [Pseudomonadota bacterium]
MKAWIFGGAAAASLAALGTLAPLGASAQIDLADRPLAGEYRAKITFLSLDVPDAPPQMADMMGRMMSFESTYCLTEAEIEEGYQAITNRSMRGDGADDCTYDRYNFTGGQIDAEMTCRVDGRQMRMTMTGTGSPTSSDITITMAGDFGMGDGSMKMRARHEWLGACN